MPKPGDRRNGIVRVLGGIIFVALVLGLLASWLAIEMGLFSFHYIEPILGRILRHN